MKISLKLFASLQDYLPSEAKKTNIASVEISDTTTVLEVIERFKLPIKMCHLVLIDGNFVAEPDRAARILREGETLSIWPPVAGG